MDQAPLPLPPLAPRPATLVRGVANAEALDRVEAWERAPRTRPLDWVMVLTGAEGSGKTILLDAVASGLGVPVRGPGLDVEAMLEGPARPVVLDDADGLAPLDLFALIEGQAGRGALLLVAGTGRPEGWAGPQGRALPDLVSRLRSVARVALGPPDEAMLADLLTAALRAHGFRPPLAAVVEVAARLRREASAPTRLATACADRAGQGYKKPAALLRDALAASPDLTL